MPKTKTIYTWYKCANNIKIEIDDICETFDDEHPQYVNSCVYVCPHFKRAPTIDVINHLYDLGWDEEDED